GSREPEVALATGKGRTALDRAVDEGIGHEVDPDDRDVRRLKRQRCRDWLGWVVEDAADRDVSRRDRHAAGGGVEDRHCWWIAKIVTRSAHEKGSIVSFGCFASSLARKMAPSQIPGPVALSNALTVAPLRCTPKGEYPLVLTPPPESNTLSLSLIS